MSLNRWMSLMRCVCFLCGAIIFAVCSASAQSSSSSNQTSSNLFSPGESSSSAIQYIADDSLDGVAALRSATSSNGSGAAAAGQAGQYANSSYNNNGNNSLALEFGGGFNAPIGNDTSSGGGGPFVTWGGNFTVGAGEHFTKRYSLLAEYQFIDDKLPGSLAAEVGTQGGNTHIWSLTLDPVIDLFPRSNNSVYVTGGGGFYRKVTNFTDPEFGGGCYFYCYGNVTVYHFSSNQGGLNAGLGFTHRISGWSDSGNMKIYAEARYLFLNTPEITTYNGTGTTELIPVTLGLRW